MRKLRELKESEVRTLREACHILSSLLPTSEAPVRAAKPSKRRDEPVMVVYQRFLDAVGRGTEKMLGIVTPALAGLVVKQLEKHDWTEAQAEEVGRWMDRQKWLSAGVAPRTVAMKWPEWVAKAMVPQAEDSEVKQARELAGWEAL